MPILSPSMPSAQFSSTRLITVSTSSWGERKWVKLQTHTSIHRIPHFQNNRHLTTFDMLQTKKKFICSAFANKAFMHNDVTFFKHGLLMKAWSNHSKWCIAASLRSLEIYLENGKSTFFKAVYVYVGTATRGWYNSSMTHWHPCKPLHINYKL